MLRKTMDTRLFVAIIAMALAISISFVGIRIADARVNNNDQVVSLSQQQDNVASRLLLARFGTSTPNGITNTVSTSTMLSDLSDTTNFKHFNSTGAIEVSQIRVNYSTQTSATTTLKFGVIASTTPSGNLSDVYWFDEMSFIAASSTVNGGTFRQEKTIDYQPSVMKLGITSGTPNSFLTNDSYTSSDTYSTTSPVISPKGYSAPGVGDLVMLVEQQGFATTSVTTLYRVK